MQANKYLGKLCKRNHDYNSTGMSLRRKNGACCECDIVSRHKVKNKCRNCKETFFSDRRGQFCSRKCYFNYHRVNIKCTYCKKAFIRRKNIYLSRAKKSKGVQFCSRECSNKYNAKKAQIIVLCKLCGKKFITLKCMVFSKWHNHKFCSKKCQQLSRRKKDRYIIAICKYCNKEYYKSKDPFQKYCSKKCLWVANSGKGNFGWKGGISSDHTHYSRIWNQKRYWKEEILWAKALPEKQCKEVMANIEALIEFKVKVLNLKHLIKTEASL